MISGTRITLALLFCILPLLFQAQAGEGETPELGWKQSMVGNLNFTQNSFDNWAQGGENSWAWQVEVNASFQRTEEKFTWSNSGKLSFGRTRVGDAESRKAADEIRFESVLSLKLKKYLNPFVSATALTQLARGYEFADGGKVAVSNFFDPAYFTQAIGLGYKYGNEFKTRLGAALKETITLDFPAPYADDPTTKKVEKTKVEMGGESVTDFSRKVSTNILFTSRLELFSNFDGIRDVDVNWDNVFSAKVSEYINVTFNVRLFYDADISRKRQLKQTLAVGLNYTFL